jgi:hypothetical protein
MLRRNRGQSIVEYAILLGVVIAALLIMQMFIKRGYQGGLKESADKLGEQFSASGTTIHQKRTMQGDQTIKEAVATDATITGFVPGDMTAPPNLADEGVYSYSERSGATQTAETKTKTEAATQERTRVGDYADLNATVADYTLTTGGGAGGE